MSTDNAQETQGSQQQVDPAASMSLLKAILENPLDAGYGAYHDEPVHGRAGVLKQTITILIAIALGIGSGIAIRGLRAQSLSEVHSSLLSHAQQQTQQISSLDEEVSKLRGQIKELSHDQDSDAGHHDAATNLANADTEVRGPGLKVTLTDAPGASSSRQSDKGQVRDQDIRMVVNALWSAGAEAVSVNGQRIGPQSFIRTAGSTILVDVTAISSPYNIEAIGNANELSLSLVRGSTGDYLSSAESLTGITLNAQSVKEMTLSARENRSTRWSTAVEGEH